MAAYAAGDYGTALTELKAAARISGAADYLPMIADCERGLGRPERALALASSPEAGALDRDGKVEMLIVAAGARRDLGQPEAAVLTLQVPALKSRARGEWLARLRYAYADALAEVGRVAEAREWFARAADVDPEGTTDAAERLDELDGIIFDESDSDDAGRGGVPCWRAGSGVPAEPQATRETRSGDAGSGDVASGSGRVGEGRSGDPEGSGSGVAGPGMAGAGTVAAPATGSDLFRAPTSAAESAVVPEDQD